MINTPEAKRKCARKRIQSKLHLENAEKRTISH